MTSITGNGKIAVVIVTYNRLEFLKRVILAAQLQTRKPDFIVVVNNSSTDGTIEWLNRQSELLVITQSNSGGAGGFHTGLKECFDRGAEWIWCMDDDVEPDNHCLEKLFNGGNSHIRVPIRRNILGQPHLGTDTVHFNFTNPFSGLWAEMLNQKHFEQKPILLEGPTFEGPLIHRSVIQTIGLPDKDFFIFADDSDFFIRAWRAGFRAELATDAILQRLLPFSMDKSADWKRYYEIRNIVTLDKRYGSIAARLLRPLFYAAKMLLASDNQKERRAVIRGLFDGIKGRLGQLQP